MNARMRRALTFVGTTAAAGAAQGLYGLACWNALSEFQQEALLGVGVLPFGHWRAEGDGCDQGAEVGVEVVGDRSPGPRFYCRRCAIAYLSEPPTDHQELNP